MTLPADTFIRVRTGGNNANGGGYSASTSGALATTLSGALTSGATTMTVASATGWPGSGNYYVQIGAAGAEPSGGGSEIVLVTSGQGTTTWTITRAQLGTTALAAASGIAVTNELSRCNTAPWSGTDGTSNASTTFTSATAGFNETVVGNYLYLASGTNGTVAAYLVSGYTNATTITLDRNCSTGAMTNGSFKIGGGWADPYTVATTTNVKPGNRIYMRASGSGSTSSPDYSVANKTPVAGSATDGFVCYIGENGKPYVKGTSFGVAWNGPIMNYFSNTYYVSGNSGQPYGIIWSTGSSVCEDCVFDQNGNDSVAYGGGGDLYRCEIFSSTANAGAAGTYAAVACANSYSPLRLFDCNVHNAWGDGISQANLNMEMQILFSVIAKCTGNGITLNSGGNSNLPLNIDHCTIDGNKKDGIYLTATGDIITARIRNCLITNQNQSGKYGINCATGTTAANDRKRLGIGQNWFYNNTSNGNNITVSSAYGDSTGTDPQYASQSTQNYALGANSFQWSAYQYTNRTGSTTPPKTYLSPGGVQPTIPRFFGGMA